MTSYNFGDITLDIPVEKLNALFSIAPQVTAFHVRDALGRIMGRYRKALMAKHAGTRFYEFAKRAVFYRVEPKNAGKRSQEAAGGYVSGQARAAAMVTRLDQIKMRIWSTSEEALLHETGGTTTAKDGKLAVPIGRVRAELEARNGKGGSRGNSLKKQFSPAAIQARYGRLVRIGDVLAIVSKDKKPEPAFALTDSVTLRARLGFYSTWRGLESDRQTIWQRAITDATREIATGSGALAKTRSALALARRRTA